MSGGLSFVIHKKLVDFDLTIVYSYLPPIITVHKEMFMARILVFEGDECLWNVLRECLESEGYTVIEACNDYEGFPQEHARLVTALPPQDTRYLIAF